MPPACFDFFAAYRRLFIDDYDAYAASDYCRDAAADFLYFRDAAAFSSFLSFAADFRHMRHAFRWPYFYFRAPLRFADYFFADADAAAYFHLSDYLFSPAAR